MKRRLALVAVALVLTGCGSSDEEPNYDSTFGQERQGGSFERSPEPPPDESISGQAFVAALQSEYPGEFGLVPDKELVSMGQSVCSAFDGGMSFAEAVEIGVSSGYSYPVSGYIIGASIGAMCPEHEGVIP